MEYQAIDIKPGLVLKSEDLTLGSKKVFRYMTFWGCSFSSLRLSYELRTNINNINIWIKELLDNNYIKGA